MIIIKPSDKAYHCKCNCGAEFIAFNNDIKMKNILVYDRFELYDFSGSSVSRSSFSLKCDVIECPFCGKYVILEDNGYKIKEDDIISNEEKNKFNKVTYNLENTLSIKGIKEKYRFIDQEEI